MALYFSDQYVHVNGEDISVPPNVFNEVGYINLTKRKNNIYVNGFKYNKQNKTWEKSFIGRTIMLEKEIGKIQLIIGTIAVIALIAIAVN